jgi:GTP cyclohydrolase I
VLATGHAAVGHVAFAAIGDISVGVLLRAKHACMARRGVRDPEAEIVTEPYEDRSRMTLASELSS